jgi:hypothetical protein
MTFNPLSRRLRPWPWPCEPKGTCQPPGQYMQGQKAYHNQWVREYHFWNIPTRVSDGTLTLLAQRWRQTSSFSLGQSALSKTCSLWPAKSTVLTPRDWICDPATIALERVGLTVEVSAAKERCCTAGISWRVNREPSAFEKLRKAIFYDWVEWYAKRYSESCFLVTLKVCGEIISKAASEIGTRSTGEPASCEGLSAELSANWKTPNKDCTVSRFQTKVSILGFERAVADIKIIRKP